MDARQYRTKLVILPQKIIDQIQAKPLDREEELRVGGGGKIKGKVYEAKIKAINLNTGREREIKTEVVCLDKEYPILGNKAMERLSLIPNPKTGEYRLE